MLKEKLKKLGNFVEDNIIEIAGCGCMLVIGGSWLHYVRNCGREYRSYLEKQLDQSRIAYNEMLLSCKDALHK